MYTTLIHDKNEMFIPHISGVPFFVVHNFIYTECWCIGFRVDVFDEIIPELQNISLNIGINIEVYTSNTIGWALWKAPEISKSWGLNDTRYRCIALYQKYLDLDKVMDTLGLVYSERRRLAENKS